mgnify:CR=1 FL=1
MNKKYRKVIIAGNWKMYKTIAEARAFAEEFKKIYQPSDVRVAVCAPYPQLPFLVEAFRGTGIGVGAQNVSEFDKGAHTGEISVDMIADLGAKYCIVGHSERRANNGDTDELVNTKVHALLEKGITPIVCVGESLSERDRDLTMERISYQVKAALYGLTAEQVKKVVIAYEPIWAIGTGRTATDEQAQEVCFNIRENLRAQYGALVSRKVCILYGGSMNAKNCAGLLAQPDIDGGLIGGSRSRTLPRSSAKAAGRSKP